MGKKLVVIAGATGYLGQHLVRAFHGAGYRVRAIARHPAKLDAVQAHVTETIRLEVTDESACFGVCRDADTVVSALGITRQKDGLDYWDVDFRANLNLLEDAKRNSVERFLFVHVLGAEALADVAAVRAKTAFVDALTRSGLDYRIVRPAGYFTDMSAFFEMAANGVVWLPGNGERKLNPIHGADLAEVCVAASEGGTRDVQAGGPDILTYNDIAALAFHALRKRPRIRRIPRWLVRASVGVLRRVTPLRVYGPIEFLASVLDTDIVGPRVGSRHLENHFRNLAQKK